MSTVQPGSFLTLHYRLAGPQGDIINTFNEKPATLSLGSGELTPGMEQRLMGLAEGTRTVIELPAMQQALLEKLSATGKPQTITTADLETALAVQGGTGVGGLMSGSSFVLTASSITFTVADMLLDKGTVMASIAQQRVGELTWTLNNPTPGAWFTAV